MTPRPDGSSTLRDSARAESRVLRPQLGGGFVWFVGAGPGDPDLITLRGWRVLQRADLVLYDSLVDVRLLAELTAERVYVGKRCGRHAMTQEAINALLIESVRAGRKVVRLKGGDPAVLGRVGEEALALAENDLPFELVPGVTSATAVPMLAGIPITHRGIADSFVVATAHRRSQDMPLSIPDYKPETTLVLLMALATADVWHAGLLAGGYPTDLPIALISAGSTPAQRVIVTTVGNAMADLRDAKLETPVLAVVGRVVELHDRLGAAQSAHEPHTRIDAVAAAAASELRESVIRSNTHAPGAAETRFGHSAIEPNAAPPVDRSLQL